jgi:hypothetical protein
VALWGFLDESGEHATSGRLTRLTLGGFFASWGNVKQLCEDWRAALDAESLGEFHMKEIASDEYNYANWPPERQLRLDRFVDVLCNCAAEYGAFSYPVGAAARAFRDTYETALARMLIVAASLAERTGDEVRLVFAHTDEIRAARIGEYFDGLRWGEYLAGYTIARSRKEPALQAAEIVSRGLKRLMEDGGITHSFGRIIDCGKPIRFWPENPFDAATSAGFSVRRLSVPK